jgi:hypothetical protein
MFILKRVNKEKNRISGLALVSPRKTKQKLPLKTKKHSSGGHVGKQLGSQVRLHIYNQILELILASYAVI